MRQVINISERQNDLAYQEAMVDAGWIIYREGDKLLAIRDWVYLW